MKLRNGVIAILLMIGLVGVTGLQGDERDEPPPEELVVGRVSATFEKLKLSTQLAFKSGTGNQLLTDGLDVTKTVGAVSGDATASVTALQSIVQGEGCAVSTVTSSTTICCELASFDFVCQSERSLLVQTMGNLLRASLQ